MFFKRFDIVKGRFSEEKLLVVIAQRGYLECIPLETEERSIRWLPTSDARLVKDTYFLSKLLRLASQDLQEAIILTKRTPLWKRVLKKMKVLR